MTPDASDSPSLVILIAEDHPVVADDLRRVLDDSGHTVCGPFVTVAASLAHLESCTVDYAFLDVELLDGRAFDIATRLSDLRIDYAFVTARADLVAEAGYGQATVVGKPFTRQDIEACLRPHVGTLSIAE